MQDYSGHVDEKFEYLIESFSRFEAKFNGPKLETGQAVR
jgi:hypothetical protein